MNEQLVGYAYFAKGSGRLNLVDNPEQFSLPHVFAIYRHVPNEEAAPDSEVQLPENSND